MSSFWPFFTMTSRRIGSSECRIDDFTTWSFWGVAVLLSSDQNWKMFRFWKIDFVLTCVVLKLFLILTIRWLWSIWHGLNYSGKLNPTGRRKHWTGMCDFIPFPRVVLVYSLNLFLICCVLKGFRCVGYFLADWLMLLENPWERIFSGQLHFLASVHLLSSFSLNLAPQRSYWIKWTVSIRGQCNRGRFSPSRKSFWAQTKLYFTAAMQAKQMLCSLETIFSSRLLWHLLPILMIVSKRSFTFASLLSTGAFSPPSICFFCRGEYHQQNWIPIELSSVFCG